MSEEKTLTHGERLQLLREHDEYGEDNDLDLAFETSWAPPREDGYLRKIERGFSGETTITLENFDNRVPYHHSLRCALPLHILVPFINKRVIVTLANNWVVTNIEDCRD